MPDSQLVNPHGGALVDRMAPESELPELKRIAGEAPHLPVDLFTTMDALNIAVGAFSPLRGFLEEADFRAVCERKQLASGLTWTVPVLLHVPPSMAKRLKTDSQLALVDREAVPFALLRVESVFTVAKSQYAQSVFGTADAAHPGVDRLAAQSDTCVGGTLTLLREPEIENRQYFYRPRETRKLFAERGWRTVAAFHTRNVPHRAHEYLPKLALSLVD